MSQHPVLSVNEREFITKALDCGLGFRVDGRRPLAMRTVKFVFGKKPGVVQVQLGATRCLACVTADIIRPYEDRPAEGKLNIFVDLSPMASPYIEPGRTLQLQELEINRIIDRGIRDGLALDVEGLCILAGEKVWAVRCDVHVLDDYGNVMDCAHLAAVAALANFRKPDVTVLGGEVTIHDVAARQPVPLALHHLPLCVSIGLVKTENGIQTLVDPAVKEEDVIDGKLTYTLNEHKQLCSLQKYGGVAVSPKKILEIAKIAEVRAAELHQLLKKALEGQEKTPAQRRELLLQKVRPIDAFDPIVYRETEEKRDKMDATDFLDELLSETKDAQPDSTQSRPSTSSSSLSQPASVKLESPSQSSSQKSVDPKIEEIDMVDVELEALLADTPSSSSQPSSSSKDGISSPLTGTTGARTAKQSSSSSSPAAATRNPKSSPSSASKAKTEVIEEVDIEAIYAMETERAKTSTSRSRTTVLNNEFAVRDSLATNGSRKDEPNHGRDANTNPDVGGSIIEDLTSAISKKRKKKRKKKKST